MKHKAARSMNARVAVVHGAAGAWRVLVADVNGGRPSVVSAETVTTDDELRSHLATEDAQQVVVVVPADSVICRTSTLPSADPEQLDHAIEIQAETQVTASTPAHRLGTAVLPAATGETNRIGMILAWPETAAFHPPAIDLPTSFAPDLAGLAALLADQRPAEALLWIDRHSGAIGLALSHANGASFRGTREAASGDEWAHHVARVLFETGLAVGHNDAFLEGLADGLRDDLAMHPEPAALILPSEVLDHAVERLDGARPDPAWWRTYGIAAGVLLAATGPLAGLTTMQEAPEIETPARWQAIASSLSRRDNAMIAVVLSILFLALLPLLVSGLQLAILRMRYPDIQEQVQLIERKSYELDMYRELRNEAWPMTKLLSDIVSSTPEGVKVKTIRVQPGSERFVLTGTVLAHEEASARRVANQMEDLITNSQIFGSPNFGWSDSSLDARDFDFSARIVRPFTRPAYVIEQDFANWTLADRKANKPPPDKTTEAEAVADDAEASKPPADALAARDSEDTAPPRDSTPTAPESSDGEDETATDGEDSGSSRPARRNIRTADGETNRRSDTVERSAGSASAIAAPEPLTEAQIDAMSKEELRSHLATLAPLRRQLRNSENEEDKVTFERVTAEWDMILARLNSK